MNNLNEWLELLKHPSFPFAAASLILFLLLLFWWLRKKRYGVPLDGKKYVFLATLAGMFAVLVKTWKPDDAWYANLLAVLGVVAGGALSCEGAPEPAKVEEPSLGLQQHEKRLQILEQLVLAKQAEIAPGDEKGQHKVEQELKAVQAKLSNVQKSYEENQRLLEETNKKLEQVNGLLPEARIKHAQAELLKDNPAEAEQVFDEVVDKEGKQVALAAFQSGKLAEDRVDYAKAMRMYKKAVTLEEENQDYLLAAGKMARTLGDYAQAREWLERLLKMREGEGQDDVDLALAQNDLAGLYNAQGNYNKAEPLFKRALDIRENKLGKDHPDVAESLNDLANLYYSQEKYAEAEPLFKRALEIYEQKLGQEHPWVATTLNNLAALYYAQKKYAKAELRYQRSLEITEKSLSKDHPEVATALNNLAGLYLMQGKYEEAKSLFKRALEIREQKLGKDHPDVASTLNNLAGLYYAQSKYAEAEPLYQRAIAILKAKFPNGHPNLNLVQKGYDELKRKMAGQQ